VLRYGGTKAQNGLHTLRLQLPAALDDMHGDTFAKGIKVGDEGGLEDTKEGMGGLVVCGEQCVFVFDIFEAQCRWPNFVIEAERGCCNLIADLIAGQEMGDPNGHLKNVEAFVVALHIVFCLGCIDRDFAKEMKLRIAWKRRFSMMSQGCISGN